MVMPCTLNLIASLASQPAFEEVSGDGPY